MPGRASRHARRRRGFYHRCRGRVSDHRSRDVALRPCAARVLPRAREDLGDEVTNEFFLSQIEIGTPVCHSLAEVRAELIRLRRGVIEAARRDDSRIAAAGTHPFSNWEGQVVTPKQRYLELQDDFQRRSTGTLDRRRTPRRSSFAWRTSAPPLTRL